MDIKHSDVDGYGHPDDNAGPSHCMTQNSHFRQRQVAQNRLPIIVSDDGHSQEVGIETDVLDTAQTIQ